MKLLLLAALLSLFYACSTPPSEDTTTSTPALVELPTGNWRATFNLNTVDSPLLLPFNIIVEQQEAGKNTPIFSIQNGEEKIKITNIKRDSNQPAFFTLDLPVFNSSLTAELRDDTLTGHWNNYTKKDYQLPFRAVRGSSLRFLEQTAPTQVLAKRWQVTFSPNTPDAYPAIGLFDVKENGRTTGTFLTETGDYRYLEGHFDGKQLQLSCFDGSHAFLFKAILNAEGQLKGQFWSGKHWQETWVATPSEDFQLKSMKALTQLKEGYTQLAFAFPNIKGDTVVYDSSKFHNKVTIVQISGSWCPNCMDATRFLNQLYQKYHKEGLEIVAIDYELSNNFNVFQKNEHKLRQDLNILYPVLFGGVANKQEASKTLPMLDQIRSYPTAIFVDKKGDVRAIHTGFSGPGTGDIYHRYTDETEIFVQQLLAE